MSLPYDITNDALRVNLVSGSISVSGADGAILDGVDPTVKATVRDLVNSNPVTVAIVDGVGDQITSFGGGVEYTEGDIDATITGKAILWEDAGNTLTPVNTSKPLPIGDAGGSLTVDGTFWQATQPVSATSLPLPTGAATSALQTQPGVDIGDVTVNNAAGVAAVNIQDGGNSLTIDGTVGVSNFPALQPVSDNAGSLTVDAPVATPVFVRLSDGAAAITALPITDNAGSLTVDAPVGTPVFVRLSDGAATLIGQKAMASSLPVVLASDQTSIPVAATLSAETTKVIGTVNQGTSPWVVTGSKTNNNAAPGATNVGVLPVLANAALPVWIEGNQVAHSTDLSGALRVLSRPPVITGAYRAHVTTAQYAGLTANNALISFRYTATGICVVTRVRVFVTTQTAATAAGRLDRALMVVRSFTVADSGGTAITLTSPFGKLRTSFAATGVGNIMVSSGGALTKGTGTEDATPFGVIATAGTATEPIGLTLPKAGMDVDLFQYNVGQNYPLILAQNEGFRISIPTAMPATIAMITAATIEWYEIAATGNF